MDRELAEIEGVLEQELSRVPVSLDELEARLAAMARCWFKVDGHEKAEFALAYKGKLVQTGSFEEPPPLAKSPRLAALQHCEGTKMLFQEGLSQPGRMNSNTFERSIGHLLSLLGFSVLYWGPDINKIKAEFPLPENQSDVVAFSPCEQALLLVECTLELGRTDKVPQLRQRAERLEVELGSLSAEASRVFPVFVSRVPRHEVPVAIKEAARTEEVVLTRSELETLEKSLAAGVPLRELVEDLPDVLRSGALRQPLQQVWPGRAF